MSLGLSLHLPHWDNRIVGRWRLSDLFCGDRRPTQQVAHVPALSRRLSTSFQVCDCTYTLLRLFLLSARTQDPSNKMAASDLSAMHTPFEKPKFIFFTDFDGTITLQDSNDYMVSFDRV